MNYLKLLLVAALLSFTSAHAKDVKVKHTFAIENGNFLYDGKAIQLHSGEMHYARVPAPYWRHRFKMMKAMGLNAVATYVFWNYHEVAPGVWDWKTGNKNLRAFIQQAAEEGLLVILRPGPYCCAEWEFGGYPWWLQNDKNMVIRSDNKAFLDACSLYLKQLTDQVRDLQITKGGPIIMVQAENEFGSYVSQRKDIPLEKHRSYNEKIKEQLLAYGIDVPLFTSDGSWLFKGGSIKGVLPTANGENSIEKLKKAVNEYNNGKGPYMVAEFYPGWLSHWAEPFPSVTTESVVKQTKIYLDAGVSFNFYMVHGGTNFGFTSGANYGNETDIQPDLTSYDYDAPISEAGWATDKYKAIRELMQKSVKYAIPAIPERIPVIALPKISLTKTYDLFTMIKDDKFVESDTLLSFEDLNQGSGYVLYRRHFNQPIEGKMLVKGIADYALVYVNGEKVGELNRVFDKDSLEINIPFNSTLDILVENMGRINYGARITQNRKGILGSITIDGNDITGDWKMYKIPFDNVPNLASKKEGYGKGLPVVYSGQFNVDKVGDTFLDMREWGKGIVFVNGINLGRYWKVGPQHTLYLPGCFLKKGNNDIVIFEQQNDSRKTELQGITEPILRELRK
ncbi:beta-galactosidase [Hoylesella nanceiensis]|uniref:beta-galactosidase n=1 Tax=Hoylesella nanceiensis TaxID=425941 RepID=UPI0028EB937D|nr:beta-galactosidase [Hoylesella nanceiensis]